ncbi:hypothetical protein [Flavobacterium sp.]|uniref:hypothetical protein n=1 Tax=Flavobacterium sp. TaxID=239 RepID=UPI0039E50F1A
MAKDSLLENVPSPRLVMIGGSNLSMSLDSQKIKDSLHLNPINMGLHAGMGLIFHLDHALPHIQKGDVVLVVPEYAQFEGNFAYGDKELLLAVCDLRVAGLADLNWRQIKNITGFVPKYAFTKFNRSEYKKPKGKVLNLKETFNQYGDWVTRFDSVHNTVTYGKSLPEVNENVMAHLKDFEQQLKARGAKLLVSFPALQDASYDNAEELITAVSKSYYENEFRVIGNAAQYRFSNDLMYDTPYHLNHKGVQIRTQMLIRDLLHADLKP